MNKNAVIQIPEFNSLTRVDIALVTESAATKRSFLKLRFPPAIDELLANTDCPVQQIM